MESVLKYRFYYLLGIARPTGQGTTAGGKNTPCYTPRSEEEPATPQARYGEVPEWVKMPLKVAQAPLRSQESKYVA